ncbi:MAG TPA: 3-oxoacyl-ACP reductase family protein [Stellaceae bacterium]|nr:3-oxoacyl-ACP reductase family protein [Stellaceae bacterium]
MRLANKIAIVTGALSGIGAGIARRFVAEGATVIGGDLASKKPSLAETAEARLFEQQLDVAEAPSITRFVDATLARFQRIDVLVNCAGIGRNIPFLETPEEVWDRVLTVNLKGTFLMAQAVARVMVRLGRGGRIINFGSISGERGNFGRAAYGASKGGVDQLSRVIAVELAPHGILVNVIAPGPVETPMVEAMLSPEERRLWTRRVPLSRYGSVEEIAAAALFLASDEASYITGHILAADGGFLAAGAMEKPEKG